MNRLRMGKKHAPDGCSERGEEHILKECLEREEDHTLTDVLSMGKKADAIYRPVGARMRSAGCPDSAIRAFELQNRVA